MSFESHEALARMRRCIAEHRVAHAYLIVGSVGLTEHAVVRPWLNPHHNANRALLLAVVDEIARNYPGIDGIHLDYIRLPDSLSDYSPATRARFDREIRLFLES